MIYVVSDIHGYYDKFKTLLSLIDLKESDTLYVIGDIIDRGPNPVSMIKLVMSMPNIKMLLGNHELMMLEFYKYRRFEYLEQWFRNGGEVTYEQFKKLPKYERYRILTFFENLPVEKELTVNGQRYILVHGNYIYESERHYYTEEELRECLVWNRVTSKHHALDDRKIIFGHTGVYHYLGLEKPTHIWYNNGYIGIDCGMSAYNHYSTCRLGCLRLDDGKEFYVD